jgi:hypothetical protein
MTVSTRPAGGVVKAFQLVCGVANDGGAGKDGLPKNPLIRLRFIQISQGSAGYPRGSYRRRGSNSRFVASRQRENAKVLVSGRFRVADEVDNFRIAGDPEVLSVKE